MIPYYQDDSVVIYHADCRDVFSELKDIDLILTDPPFFVPVTHYSSRSENIKSWGDLSVLGVWFGVIVETMIPKIKNTSSVAFFCDGPSHAVFFPELYRRFNYVRTLVWDKLHFGMGSQWRKQHELILVGRQLDSKWTGPKNLPDILKAKKVPHSKRLHPVDKPEDILKQLINPLTDHGDMVVDPFCGGGSTLVAAKQTGRKAIGIEIEERYCEISARRCSHEMDIFTTCLANPDA